MTYTEWAERQATHYVRWLIRRDMAELLAIDDATHGGPWGEDAFLACLRQRNCIGMVAERHTRIVGFMLYELRPSSIRVLRMGGPLAARVEMTGRLVEKLSDHRRTRIVAAVDDHDDDAIRIARFCQVWSFETWDTGVDYPGRHSTHVQRARRSMLLV